MRGEGVCLRGRGEIVRGVPRFGVFFVRSNKSVRRHPLFLLS